MNHLLHPMALFRLMVLGPLTSREALRRGELKKLVCELATRPYTIPGSKRSYLSEETIIRWYYLWKEGGVEALNPTPRADKGTTQLLHIVQSTLIQFKEENPARSINTLIAMLEAQGIASKDTVARATVHRFLQQQQLSQRTLANAQTIERRSFVAAHAGDLWQGDVLHGPSIQTPQGRRKTYLVSLMDDASRLIAHSAFCLSETALDIEGVLKQALLKRGLPQRLLLDNGSAYRSSSLQAICARLGIRLIYCRPYEPEGKGKLERFHRTFREQFLTEINLDALHNLGDLNARLWAWLEQVYHQRPHTGLTLTDSKDLSPLQRWRNDLLHVRPLTPAIAHQIDDCFYHRVLRKVLKDGTLNWEGRRVEVDYRHVGKKVVFVFDPHTDKPIRIETEQGEDLGPAVLSNIEANRHRKRQRPLTQKNTPKPTRYAVDLMYDDYCKSTRLSHLPTDKDA